PLAFKNWFSTGVLVSNVERNASTAGMVKLGISNEASANASVRLAKATPSLLSMLVLRSFVRRPLDKIIKDHGTARKKTSVPTIVRKVHGFKCLHNSLRSKQIRNPASERARPKAISDIAGWPD